MTMLRLSLTASLLALAACGSGTTNAANETTNAAPANEAAAPAAPAAPTAPAAAPGAVTAEYMIGKWSAMDEDCKDTLEFRKDGTVKTPIGDAKWTLSGDKLSVDYGEPGSNPTASSIKPLGPDRIEITTSSGRKETEKRC